MWEDRIQRIQEVHTGYMRTNLPNLVGDGGGRGGLLDPVPWGGGDFYLDPVPWGGFFYLDPVPWIHQL